MKLTRQSLDEAARQGLLQSTQVEPLWRFLAARDAATPSFRAAHILYYAGGLIAIGAMSLFVTLAWERLGGRGLLVIALVYIGLAVAATEFLLRRNLAIPAGLLGALAVALVPLAIYGAQLMLGLWPEDGAPRGGYRSYHTRIDWRWFFMELGTVAAGVISLAFVVDLRSRHGRDFPFWLYLFGVTSFWGGMTAMDSTSELGRFVYALINVAMIAVGAALSRRVFAVFGGIGLATYLGHLSWTVFKDSLLFPIALTVTGLAVVALGIWWQRHERAIGTALRALLPAAVRGLVEARSDR